MYKKVEAIMNFNIIIASFLYEDSGSKISYMINLSKHMLVKQIVIHYKNMLLLINNVKIL